MRGQDIGSSSDLQIALTDPADDFSAVSTTTPDSIDPLILFYADRPGTFYVNVADQYYGYGDDYIWEMIASATKARPRFSRRYTPRRAAHSQRSTSVETASALKVYERLLSTLWLPPRQ